MELSPNGARLAAALAAHDKREKARQATFLLIVQLVVAAWNALEDHYDPPGALTLFRAEFGHSACTRLCACCNYFNTASQGWREVLKLYNDVEFECS